MAYLMFNNIKEATIECKDVTINTDLLFKLSFGIYDSDGYEYHYTIFDLAKRPTNLTK